MSVPRWEPNYLFSGGYYKWKQKNFTKKNKMDYYVLLQAGTNSDKFEYINKIQLTRRKIWIFVNRDLERNADEYTAISTYTKDNELEKIFEKNQETKSELDNKVLSLKDKFQNYEIVLEEIDN